MSRKHRLEIEQNPGTPWEYPKRLVWKEANLYDIGPAFDSEPTDSEALSSGAIEYLIGSGKMQKFSAYYSISTTSLNGKSPRRERI